MNDTDVQIVREFVDAKKADTQGWATGYLDKIIAQEAHNAAEEAEKQRKTWSKEERLGMK